MQRGRILFSCMALVALSLPALAAPDEDLLGKAAGYPIGTRANWFYKENVRVGSFSNLDSMLPHYTLTKSVTPLPLPAAPVEAGIEYRFEKQTWSLDDFLAHQRVTGFLLIKDGEILAERYQYNRNAGNRFISHSMSKSIVSLAIGLALAENKIASLDDTVAKYVPELSGNPYGETTIRNLLRMASGVPFSEVYDGKDDLAKFNRIRFTQDSITALREFKTREVEQGTPFSLCFQPDRGADAAAARGDRDLAERISHPPALAANGRGSRRDMGEDQGRHRNRIGKLQCDPARLWPSGNSVGQ
jgi:CubicO group peptidase (beta-lactamase class C family)